MDRKLYAFIVLCVLLTLCLCACGTVSDNVTDPLTGYNVDAVIPFATKAPVVTPQPTKEPAPTPAPTAQGISWQSDYTGSSNTTYRPVVTPTPTPIVTPGPREEELSFGSKGNNVKLMQNRLIKFGYLSGNADGKFGSMTESAVKLYQETVGLEVTGIADLITLKYIYADQPTYSEMIAKNKVTYSATPVPSVQGGYTLLERGSKGSEVIKLQTRLIQLGYLVGDADGDFGNDTANAVALFQRQIGWELTGVASSSLQSYLFSKTAPKYTGKSPIGASSAQNTLKPTIKPTTSVYTQLSPGDSGSSVKKLQSRLIELGYLDAEASGNYLAKTTEAVKLFQAENGLKSTGVATAAMQEKLFSSSALFYTGNSMVEETITAAPTAKSSVLEYGSTGEYVRTLQGRLIELGYLTGKADGKFSSKTEQAVILFQEACGLKRTGIVDSALYKRILSDNAPEYIEVMSSVSEKSGSQKADTVILQPGDSGNKVMKLQTALHDLGYYDGNVDGSYMTFTEEAVQAAQRVCGYTETGTVTYALAERIFNSSAPTLAECERYMILYPGDKGETVKAMQQRLYDLGLFPDCTSADVSKFTRATLDAVIRAQKKRGLTCTDDFASAEFQAYLFSDAAYYDNGVSE